MIVREYTEACGNDTKENKEGFSHIESEINALIYKLYD